MGNEVLSMKGDLYSCFQSTPMKETVIRDDTTTHTYNNGDRPEKRSPSLNTSNLGGVPSPINSMSATIGVKEQTHLYNNRNGLEKG
jgi:hypothetical protein